VEVTVTVSGHLCTHSLQGLSLWECELLPVHAGGDAPLAKKDEDGRWPCACGSPSPWLPRGTRLSPPSTDEPLHMMGAPVALMCGPKDPLHTPTPQAVICRHTGAR
jgi:hypothetical protein